MINTLKNLVQMPLNLMSAVAQARPSKHAKGWHKPKRRKKYRDKCRVRYVARIQERMEAADRQKTWGDWLGAQGSKLDRFRRKGTVR